MTDQHATKQLPLAQRLRIKASMIQMGEAIAYHSEVTLMIEAANRLEQLERLLASRPCP